MKKIEITSKEVDDLYKKLNQEAEDSGYHLNPDIEFTKMLLEGILVNEKRYGYWLCPCRRTSGSKEKDMDIICPCDYRDPDLNDYHMCYCALYVSDEVLQGKKEPAPIPERRGNTVKSEISQIGNIKLPYPLWRCKVCGYLCVRENPPLKCPVCKADKDRFEKLSN